MGSSLMMVGGGVSPVCAILNSREPSVDHGSPQVPEIDSADSTGRPVVRGSGQSAPRGLEEKPLLSR